MKPITHWLLSGLALLAGLSGCTTDSQNTTDKAAANPLEAAAAAAAANPVEPREYEIEYRFSSSTEPRADIGFFNETGGNTDLKNVKLPASYKIKRTMKLYDGVAASAYVLEGKETSDITAVILLDGKEVETQTSRGASAGVNLVYQIGL